MEPVEIALIFGITCRGGGPLNDVGGADQIRCPWIDEPHMVSCSSTIKDQVWLVLPLRRKTEVFMEPRSTADSIDAELRAVAASFSRPSVGRSLLQLVTNSFGPFLAGCAAMYVACDFSPWLALAFAITDRRVHGARVHRAARLRTRLVLRFPAAPTRSSAGCAACAPSRPSRAGDASMRSIMPNGTISIAAIAAATSIPRASPYARTSLCRPGGGLRTGSSVIR